MSAAEWEARLDAIFASADQVEAPGPFRPRAALALEAIGDGMIGAKRPWVARIVACDPVAGLERVFLRPAKDYTGANSVGTRGVMLHFILDPGCAYEVFERVSWSRSRRYFCRALPDGGVEEISEGEACRSVD